MGCAPMSIESQLWSIVQAHPSRGKAAIQHFKAVPVAPRQGIPCTTSPSTSISRSDPQRCVQGRPRSERPLSDAAYPAAAAAASYESLPPNVSNSYNLLWSNDAYHESTNCTAVVFASGQRAAAPIPTPLCDGRPERSAGRLLVRPGLLSYRHRCLPDVNAAADTPLPMPHSPPPAARDCVPPSGAAMQGARQAGCQAACQRHQPPPAAIEGVLPPRPGHHPAGPWILVTSQGHRRGSTAADQITHLASVSRACLT